MYKAKKRTRIFYRYAAIYFVVLFLLSATLLLSVLWFSAQEVVSLETQNTEKSMLCLADMLEKQHQTLEGVAIRIGMTPAYRPNMINRGPIYDIELLEKFRQYVNYSPLAQEYFIVYNSVNKIYTSTGHTSYFDYYAPLKLQVPYELTGEILWEILGMAQQTALDMGENILLVFPLRFYGYDMADRDRAALCFALRKADIRSYVDSISVGLPEKYAFAVDGHDVFSTTADLTGDAERNQMMEVMSAGGRVKLRAVLALKGWQLLLAKNSWLLYLGAIVVLVVACLVALGMAHFSLRPLDKLLRKYMPNDVGIDSEFRQLDEILHHMDQLRINTCQQLRNHLLLLLLRGSYSQQMLQRWSMLGITFDQPVCCVFLVKGDGAAKEEVWKKLEALGTSRQHIYTTEDETADQLIVVANYDGGEGHEAMQRCINQVADQAGLTVVAGRPVDSPKRLPLSYMAALTAGHYEAHAQHKSLISVDLLADRMITAVRNRDEIAVEQAGEAISAYLMESAPDGVLTRHRVYELISRIIHKADDADIFLNKSEVNALVLLPDVTMITNDLKRHLIAGVRQTPPHKLSGDDTARLIVEYVIANAYDPDFNLQDIATSFGLSADYISGMIKRETGSAFKEYLTMLRISEAQRLLAEDKSLMVSDVALRVGYRKASNFSKKFKELTGTLPSHMK